MGGFRLLGFECKKQISSFTFLAVLALFTVFAVSQLTEIFHLPVRSEQDIQALNRSGEREYITVENSEADLAAHSIKFLKQRIADGSISQNTAAQFDEAIKMLGDGQHSFDDVMEIMQDNEVVFPWLLACKAQFGERLGTVEEANQNMLSSLGDTAYNPKLYEKYVTYMQIISALIIFPLFLFLFTRDYRHSMYEIIYAQPIAAGRYIISRYLSIFIPLTCYLYVWGLALGLISAGKFITAGYAYQYTAFFPYFVTYLLPAVFFFSSLIMLLMLLLKKAVAVFPVYAIFVILNVTPDAFGLGGNWMRVISPIIRLDEPTGGMAAIMLNRSVYIAVGMVFILIACQLYKRLRHDLRKGITI